MHFIPDRSPGMQVHQLHIMDCSDKYILSKSHFLFLICSIAICLQLISCKDTFEPWQENEHYHFSIHGYLDASADTQWVRVMPVREDLFFEPRPLGATVTLKHEESGETAVMEDSLFTYFQGYAWNFSSGMAIEPEQTYTITAEYPDGRASHATVQLPEDFPTPVIEIAESQGEDVAIIKEVNHLADVLAVYHARDHNDKILIRAISHIADTSRTFHGDLQVHINPRRNARELEHFPPVFKRQIFTASASQDLIDFGQTDERVIALPQGVSNIRNGVGYLAGIISKTTPYERCVDENMQFVPCELQPPPW